MKFRKFRLMNTSDASAGGGTAAPAATEAPATTLLTGEPAAPATDTPAPSAGATEQTATDPTSTEAKTDEAATPPAKVVPEKYEFTAPEGVTLDPEALGEFEGIAKEFKLSQEEAQKVADVGAKLAKSWDTKQANLIQQAAADWANATATDKEFGGGALPANLAIAKKALNAFGTPELTQLLNGSRLGNHPEVIRFMVRAGKAISEDRMVTSGTGETKSPTASHADALYPVKN